MAPAAKIAAYKVCFDDNDPDTGDCFTGATVAAIDDAIADGVDVINYSISGATDTVIDAIEFAFEGAAEAGIFVATSAGNSGPDASTVAHNSPWLTTVAATHPPHLRQHGGARQRHKIRGASISQQALPQTRLISSVNGARRRRGTAEDAGCAPPAAWTRPRSPARSCVCDRGVNDRVDKSAAVKQAGGVGMILANITPGSPRRRLPLGPDRPPRRHRRPPRSRSTPSARRGHRRAFKLGDATGGRPRCRRSPAFSSRGPSLASAATSSSPTSPPPASASSPPWPRRRPGRNFDFYSGTSMASPHIAGLAAFMIGKQPVAGPR